MYVGDMFQTVRGSPETRGGPVMGGNQFHKQERAVHMRAVSTFEDYLVF